MRLTGVASIMLVGLALACDRGSPISPRNPMAVASLGASDTATHVVVQDSDRFEWKREGKGARIHHYRNGELVADGLVQDKKNGKITVHRHGINVVITVEDGITTDLRVVGATKANRGAGGMHTMFDYDGDGWDDDTGEYVGQSCCKAEVSQLKRDGSTEVLAAAGVVYACGVVIGEALANPIADGGCGLALVAYGVAMYWVNVDIDELAACIKAHPGCTNWACAEPARGAAWPALAVRKETTWMRIS